MGVTKENHAVMRVWQVAGGSVSHEPVGWKLLRLDEATGASVTNQKSLAPRPGIASQSSELPLHVLNSATPPTPGANSTATAGITTLFSGRSDADEARAAISLFCISPAIAADTILLTGNAGACAAFHARNTPLLPPSTGSSAV